MLVSRLAQTWLACILRSVMFVEQLNDQISANIPNAGYSARLAHLADAGGMIEISIDYGDVYVTFPVD